MQDLTEAHRTRTADAVAPSNPPQLPVAVNQTILDRSMVRKTQHAIDDRESSWQKFSDCRAYPGGHRRLLDPLLTLTPPPELAM